MVKMDKMRITMLLLSFCFGVSLMVQAQPRKAAPARVEKIEGVPLFVYALPAAGYEVVGKAVTAGHLIKLSVDEVSSVEEKTARLVKAALARWEKGKVPPFDGIIVDLDREKVLAFRLKEQGDTLMAKVLRQDSVPVYFYSHPVGDYVVVDTLAADYSLWAQRGLLYDKIRSMISRTLKKEEEGQVPHFDAVIIDPADLSEVLIRFP